MTDVFVGDLLSERSQTVALRFSEGAERLPELQGLPLLCRSHCWVGALLAYGIDFGLIADWVRQRRGAFFWRYVEASRKLGGLTHDVLHNDFIEEWRETGLGDGNV